jgi:ribonuclease E
LRASTSYKAVAETQTLKTSDATKIEAVTAANSQSGTPQSTPLTISDYSEIEGHVTTSSNDDNIDDTDDQTDDDTDDQTDDDTDDQTDDDTDDQTDDDTDDQTDDDNNDDSNVEGGDDGDESGD